MSDVLIRTSSSSSTRSAVPSASGAAPVGVASSSSSTGTALIGSHSSTAVPSPGRLAMVGPPPSSQASPCTIESPSPVPRPTPLVEKDGSTARASVASSMPVLVSRTGRRT